MATQPKRSVGNISATSNAAGPLTNPQGIAYGPGGQPTDSWGAVLQHLQQGLGPQGAHQSLLENFKGTHWDLIDFLNSGGSQFLATSLFNDPSYQFLQDPNNWDQSMQAYGAASGQLGQASAQGLQQSSNQLSRMGLGRSGAQAAIANQAAQQLGGQNANLFSNLYQQGVQNRLAGAQRGFDATRSIMQLALGMGADPRISEQKRQSDNDSGLWGPIASILGTAAGSFLGGVGGGVGSAIGGSIGGAAGKGATDAYG